MKSKRVEKKNKGVFITFEGGEGAGKTTLIHRIFEALSQKGYHLMETLEPGGCELGKDIRKLLLHQTMSSLSPYSELFLYLADRAQHVQEIILPALESGQIVLCDRFNDSTMAYQGAARSLDLELIKNLCELAASGLVPDLTFYLDLDPEVGLKRAMMKKTYDRLEEEAIEFHLEVRKAFLSLAKSFPKRIEVIDATLEADEVFSWVLQKVEAYLCSKDF